MHRSNNISNFDARAEAAIGTLLAVSIAISSFSAFGIWGGLIIAPHIPLILAIGLGIVLHRRYGSKFEYRHHEYWAFGFIGLTLLSALAYPNSKTIPYILVYLLSFGIFLRGGHLLAAIQPKLQLHNVNMWAVGIVSTFCVIEFILGAYFGFSLQEKLPRLNRASAYCTLGVPRAYGPSLEPTYLSWYLNTLGLLGLYSIWHHSAVSNLSRCIATAVFTFAYCAAFSIAAAGSLLFSIGLFLCLAAYRRFWVGDAQLWTTALSALQRAKLFLSVVAATIFIFVANVFWLTGPAGATSCFGRGLEKVTLRQEDKATVDVAPSNMVPIATGVSVPPPVSNNSLIQDPKNKVTTQPQKADAALVVSEQQSSISIPETREPVAVPADPPKVRLKINRNRQEIWAQDIETALKHPLLGRGPGYKSSIDEYSSVNLFLFVMLEQGVPALIMLLGFFVSCYYWISNASSEIRWVYLIGFGAGSVQLATMTQHYYTNLWLLLLLFQLAKPYAKEGHQSLA
jgi:hypothetical protein